MSYMSPFSRDLATEVGDFADCYDIRLTLSVGDRNALWDSAAAQLRAAGLLDDEIADCIGTSADISLGDCLTTLFAPLAPAGCALTDIAVQPVVPDLGELLLAAAEATQQIGLREFAMPARFPS